MSICFECQLKKTSNRSNSSIYAYRAQTSHAQEERADAIRTKNEAIGDEENTHVRAHAHVPISSYNIFSHSYSESFMLLVFFFPHPWLASQLTGRCNCSLPLLILAVRIRTTDTESESKHLKK